MANEFLKAAQIVDAANLLLQREVVLPRLVTRYGLADFQYALDDTVTHDLAPGSPCASPRWRT